MSVDLAPMMKLLEAMDRRMAAIESKIGSSGASTSNNEESGTSQHVESFDAEVMPKVNVLMEVSQKIGDEATKLGELVKSVFNEQRNMLQLASKCKKPSPAQLPTLMKGLNAAAKQASDYKGDFRNTDFQNHATAVNEGIPAAQWIVIDSLPHSVVESYRDGAVFWLNKVRVAHKGKDDNHAAWCDAFVNVLNALYDFVKANFKTGLTWNPAGDDISNVSSTAAPPASEPKAAAQPQKTAPAKQAASIDNVFSQLRSIDQSSGKTAGLRHVTKDMKSSATKGAAPVSSRKPAASSAKPAAKDNTPKRPPRKELVGKRWFLENYVDGEPIVLDEISLMQELYIANCKNATVIIKGKCKVMQIERCERCKILFDSLISTCDIVDCKRCQVQVNGSVPSVCIDKTDGIVVYLSYASRTSQIVTSKSSEINVSFPKSEDADAEWIELPIPEQFVSKLTDKNTINTTVSELYSS